MQKTSYQRYKMTCSTGVTLSLWVVRNFVHVSLHSRMTVQAAFESLSHFAVRVNVTGAASLTHKASPLERWLRATPRGPAVGLRRHHLGTVACCRLTAAVLTLMAVELRCFLC